MFMQALPANLDFPIARHPIEFVMQKADVQAEDGIGDAIGLAPIKIGQFSLNPSFYLEGRFFSNENQFFVVNFPKIVGNGNTEIEARKNWEEQFSDFFLNLYSIPEVIMTPEEKSDWEQIQRCFDVISFAVENNTTIKSRGRVFKIRNAQAIAIEWEDGRKRGIPTSLRSYFKDYTIHNVLEITYIVEPKVDRMKKIVSIKPLQVADSCESREDIEKDAPLYWD